MKNTRQSNPTHSATAMEQEAVAVAVAQSCLGSAEQRVRDILSWVLFPLKFRERENVKTERTVNSDFILVNT